MALKEDKCQKCRKISVLRMLNVLNGICRQSYRDEGIKKVPPESDTGMDSHLSIIVFDIEIDAVLLNNLFVIKAIRLVKN